jgi:hypothetical protein
MISGIREVTAFGVVARIAHLENGVEVIPMPEVSELLGVNLPTINEHLSNLFGQTETIPKIPLSELRQHGIAPQGRGRPPRLITKQEFQYLVKKVNTPQAWSVYQELWGAAEAHIQAMDGGMPAWAAEFKKELQDVKDICHDARQRADRTEQSLQDVKDICRGLRDEVDELRATLNLLINEDDEKMIRELIRRIKDKYNCDGRAVVGKVRATLNVGSIYETPDTRKVINTLKNLLGEGLTLVKEENSECSK